MKMRQILFSSFMIAILGLGNSNLQGWCYYVRNQSKVPTQVDSQNGRGVEAFTSWRWCNNMWTPVLNPGDQYPADGKSDCTKGNCNTFGANKIVVRALDRTFTLKFEKRHASKGNSNLQDLHLTIKDFQNNHGKWVMTFNLQGTNISGYAHDATQAED